MTLSIKLSSISLVIAEGSLIVPEGMEANEMEGLGPDSVTLDAVEFRYCCLFPNSTCPRFRISGRCPREKDTCVELNAFRHSQRVFSIWTALPAVSNLILFTLDGPSENCI